MTDATANQPLGPDPALSPQMATVEKGPGRWIVWATAIGLAGLLVIGAVVVVTRAGSASGGAGSPEEATDMLIEAINSEDLVAIAELMEPAERRSMMDPMFEMVDEFSRLGLLADDVDMSSIAGVDLELTDVTYSVDEVAGADDLRVVRLTGGSSSASADASQLPFGDAVLDRFSDELTASETTSDVIEPSDEGIVMVERDGRWYVSLWHTVAEAARGGEGSVPTPEQSPAALGSASPEAAAQAFISNLIDLDVEAMIGRLDPEEAAALYRYAPLFLDDAISATGEVHRAAADMQLDWDVSNMTFDVDSDGDDAIATLRTFTATVQATQDDVDIAIGYAPNSLTVAGNAQGINIDAALTMDETSMRAVATVDDGFEVIEVDVTVEVGDDTITVDGVVAGEPITAALEFLPGCTRYSFEAGGQADGGCLEDVLADMGVPSLDELGIDLSAQSADSFAGFELPGIPMATHRVDGEWFISPMGTMMNAYLGQLRSMERDDVETMLDLMLNLGTGASSVMLGT